MQSARPAPSSVYDAHPLNLQDLTSIRVIELVHDENHTRSAAETSLPELRASSVSYKLHVVPLQDAPPYIALSYVWGSPDVTRTIFVDGKPVTIRKNLYEFLSHYDSEGPRSYLWIDALCINQDCVAERNHQVGIMGSIYSRAEMVIAWLGPGFEKELTQLPKAWEDAAAEQYSGQTCRSGPLGTAEASLKTCLETLSRSEYWSRLWIVQEFLLNPRLALMSGNASLDMNANAPLLKAFPSMITFDLFSTIFPTVMYSVIWYREGRVGQRRRFDLPELIDEFKALKCADVRDRAFGLLGLLDQESLQKHPIAIDYSQSATTLFFNLCTRQLKMPRQTRYTLNSFAQHVRQALELPEDLRAQDGSIPSQSTVGPEAFGETLALLRKLGGQEYTELSKHLVWERHDWIIQTEGSCRAATVESCEMCYINGLNPF